VVAKGVQEAQQQIVRIDRVDTGAVEGAVRDRLIELVDSLLPTADALLISDYENGVISPEVLEACLPAARARGITITVDAHGNLLRFKGVTAATPNQPEVEGTLRTVIRDEQDLRAAGRSLLEQIDAEGVLITRSREPRR
jgi:bifunctional ADP-heptose synthase (sugar kinase/adenylyltransferase)